MTIELLAPAKNVACGIEAINHGADAVIAAIAALAWRTRFKWLYFIATAVMLGGAVLLIGFPNYVLFVALILGGLSLVGEAFWLGVYIKSRLSAGASARLKK